MGETDYAMTVQLCEVFKQKFETKFLKIYYESLEFLIF